VKRKLSPRALYGIVAGGLLVYALFGWFVLVGPKRAAAAGLKEQVAAAEQSLADTRRAAAASPDAQPIKVADIFRLSTAMPSTPDMPGILLELSRIAGESGIQFNSITPQLSKQTGAYQSVPISLEFNGNFYELSDFLFRLRTLVGIRHGELHSSGRLFVVRSLIFVANAADFPDLSASLTVETFVYGSAAPATTAPPATPPAEGTATTTTPAAEAPVPPVDGATAEAGPEVTS
jgi:hypothetical protein